ncbi:MAG: endonuclease/exonuclease/phosphatase family protein [Aureispira sp.]
MEASKREKTYFRVASFNLLNLALPSTVFYRDQQYSEAEYADKKAWIAAQLTKLDADIIGFQELFDEKALQEVVKDHPLYKGATVVMGARKGGSPAVALVSRFPVQASSNHTHFMERLDVEGLVIPFEEFSRPILKVRVELRKGLSVEVFVAHLKSKRPLIPDGVDRHDALEISKGKARSLLLRATEANALRTILMDTLEHRDTPVVVLGDLNDTHTAVTTRIISGEEPPRYWPKEHKAKVWDTLLYHAKDIQARQSSQDVYYTHIHNGHYESLDHILVSQELVRENPKRVGRVVYVQSFNDHIIDQTFASDRVNSCESDHAQVVATIELDPPYV